jgi:serine/threonine protein kinase
MPLEPNTLLNNRYRIRDKLGSGGMGAVYQAHDENLDVEVAVKENFFVSEESARQFRREARVLFELKHPGLPSVIDQFAIPDQGQYLVMDYIQGEDARQILEHTGGPLEQAEVMRWAKEILEALQYLHTRRPPIIHRDLKPANIKITPAGQAMLVDFGLAKEFDPTKSTTVGAKAFTPGFAPPEQYGQARTDPRTDVYALGATLYNLLTHRLPADGLRRAMGKEQLIPVRELNPAVSPPVAAAIEKATEVKPDDRFQSAEAFSSALFAGRTILAPPPRPVVPSATLVGETFPALPTRPRRSILPYVIGGVLLLALGGGAGALISGAFGGGSSPPGDSATPSAVSVVQPNPVPPTSIPPPTEGPTRAPPTTEIPTAEPTAPPVPSQVPTAGNTPVGGGRGQIAFASDQTGLPQIYLIDLDGQNLTQLTMMADGACQPAWSPDGAHLLFTSPCREKREDYANAAIFIMNSDGSGLEPLISLVGGVYDADWSEAGIAFTWLENGMEALWIAEPDGSNQQRLSVGRSRDSQASWAPAGDRLAIMNTSRVGSQTLFWVFDDGTWEGSNPDQISRDQVATQPDWSPNGDLLTYVTGFNIWIVPWDALGFGAVRISDRGPNDGPSWSPDGRWIVFETWREAANHDIYLMTANGGQPTRITTDPAADFHPAWRP